MRFLAASARASEDGALLASAATDGTVRVWRLSGGDAAAACVAVLEGHTDSVTGLADLVDDSGARTLATVAADHSVRLWTEADAGATMRAGSVFFFFGPARH